jgi:HK97 family phage portal protein
MAAPAFLRRWLAPDPPAPPETRRGGPWMGDGWGAVAMGGSQWAGPTGGAESVTAVAACVNLIASAIASLPPSLLIDTPEGPTAAPPGVAAWRLIKRPSPFLSWPAFIGQAVASILLRGNSLAAITTDARGGISGLTAVPWAWVNPQVINSGDGTARLVFDIVPNATPEARLLNLPRRLLADDALFLRARSDNGGIIGRSVLSRAASAVTEGAEIARMAQSNWANGMRPSGVLTAPTFLSDTQRERFGPDWMEKFTGSINAGKVPLLEGGWGLSQVSMTSVDAEFLASRQFSVADICRLFNVPEVLLQIGTRSITDLSSYVTSFAQLCLSPLVTTIESEFDAILPAGMHLRLDLDGLQRGSFSAVVAALCALQQSGAITANDTRGELGWPPIDGGDALRPSGAPTLPADFKGGDHMGQSPGATGDNPPAPGTNQNDGAS